jgi:exo-beta-1,3-glucanase (GH17 family)
MKISKYAKSIRIYAMVCGHENHILHAIPRHKLTVSMGKISIIIGLWVNEYNATFSSQLDLLIKLLSAPTTTVPMLKSIDSIVVGNEAYFRKEQTIPELIVLINIVRRSLSKINNTDHIMLSTADVYLIYIRSLGFTITEI